MVDLRSFLEQLRKLRNMNPRPENCAYFGMEDLLLQRGSEFEFRAHPGHPIARQCFALAYRRAVRRNSPWIYCEGYAVPDNGIALPTHHAWVAHADDPTGAYELAWDTPGTAYLGIAFRPEYVRQMHRSSKWRMYSAIDTWWADYPLLSGDISLDDVIWRAK